ncbi:succinylglutamate desuccinylase/aspartoacylase family protein [Haloterrigena sp. SYSU A558-1]|uniref:Succinylglutamate desuccinylase/aspartoacylase family protein n=1 Tax=Haloterrigena gelatinilytica TaxID=2741724 RepID=A0ABX2LGZ5_9EURY|nr:succinylglutamate desuccinylase/aspartoacylase family protein [Haloterrigena gelatinilytica]NUC72872.1 succinylglutamate desuccinylase/aspartoacylase family protein [Haloterrigena gelatinilytica]
MQRNALSRRSVLSFAGACAIAGAGATAVDGAQADGTSRESFTIREGTAEETTVYVTSADVDGPTVVVIGGVHGNEVAGYTATGAIADWEIGAGTLVTIPKANAAAVENGTRTADDGVDLNRQFLEGREPGTDLARALWSVVVEYDPDVVIDLHESTGIYANDPVDGVGQAIFHSDGEAAAAAADAAEYVTRNYVDDQALAFQTGPFSSPDNDPRGLLVHKAARDLGADAFLAETLSTGVPLETRVQWHSAIVERLLTDDLRLEAADGNSGSEENETDDGSEENESDDGADENESDDGADENESDDGADENETDDGEAGEDETNEEDATDEAEADENESAEDETAAEAPVASITACPRNFVGSALESGQTVQLDASGSKARGGEIVRYEWDVGQTAQFDKTGETITVTVGTNVRDTIVLRVTTADGATDTDSITLSTN